MIRDPRRSQRSSLLLTLGAAAGVACAAVGLLWSRPATSTSLPTTAVARVNGQAINLEDYQRLVNAVAQDRRSGVDETERRHVLDRLIEEELLVERGLELGLAQHDTKVRKDLTAAVIDAVVAGTEGAQPSEQELRAFFESNRDFFTGPDRLHVRQVWCRATSPGDAPAALERAQQAVARLRAGEDFVAVRSALGDPEIAPLPDAFLPPNKLADYLGPTALRTALSLDAGAVSDPVRSNTGYHVLQVLQRQAESAPVFDQIRPHVLMEYQRRTADQALRNYLNDLRRHAEIEIAPTLP